MQAGVHAACVQLLKTRDAIYFIAIFNDAALENRFAASVTGQIYTGRFGDLRSFRDSRDLEQVLRSQVEQLFHASVQKCPQSYDFLQDNFICHHFLLKINSFFFIIVLPGDHRQPKSLAVSSINYGVIVFAEIHSFQALIANGGAEHHLDDIQGRCAILGDDMRDAVGGLLVGKQLLNILAKFAVQHQVRTQVAVKIGNTFERDINDRFSILESKSATTGF